MIRPQAEAEKDLADILPLIGPAMLNGLEECGKEQGGAAHRFRKVTKRNISRDYVADRLRNALDGKLGVHIHDHSETTDFWFASKYRARVHHADEEFEIALGKSLQSSLFDDNAMPMLGDDFEPTCLYFLYVPQKADPTAVEFYVMCPGENGWVRALEVGGGEVVGHISSSLGVEDDEVKITLVSEVRHSDTKDDAVD
jgi:hypothetical protein